MRQTVNPKGSWYEAVKQRGRRAVRPWLTRTVVRGWADLTNQASPAPVLQGRVVRVLASHAKGAKSV